MSGIKDSKTNKVNVDLDYLRQTYFRLRSELIQELAAVLGTGGLDEETLMKQMDLDLTSTMVNIIANCNIIDLPEIDLDLTDSKTIHHLLIRNANMLNSVPKDLALQNSLHEEFAKFDGLCIKKGEMLNEFAKFNTAIVMDGGEVIERYLLDIDSRMEEALDSDADMDVDIDDDEMRKDLDSRLDLLTESMANINALETSGSLQKQKEKFLTLQSKVGFLVERLENK